MPDYQELYHKLFRATEDAINRLIQAQQECEELYISENEPEAAKQQSEKRKNVLPTGQHVFILHTQRLSRAFRPARCRGCRYRIARRPASCAR